MASVVAHRFSAQVADFTPYGDELLRKGKSN
jgi:hypothetical protein